MAENSKDICFYFQIHQPYRINPDTTAESDSWKDYFVGQKAGKYGQDMTNEAIFNKVAISCYLPTTNFWLNYLKNNPQVKISLSFSGTFLEQCQEFAEYGDRVLSLFKELIATNQVEVFGETYYHSLAFLVDLKEYLEQIQLHRNLVKRLFDIEPTTFRNTELIYNNHIGEIIRSLGYDTVVIEDAPQNPRPNQHSFYNNFDYKLDQQDYDLISKYTIKARPNPKLKLFFRDIDCSDGLMFVAKDPFVPGLLAKNIISSSELEIGIFTDYEFLGEHDNKDNLAVINLQNQLDYLLANGLNFKTIAEVATKIDNSLSSINISNQIKVSIPKTNNGLQTYNCPEFTSWAHKERDITVWRGGDYQEQAFLQLESLYWQITKSHRSELLEAWRRLSTSCHFYFLGDKTGFDGEFVKLFSPYESIEHALDSYLKVLYNIKAII